MKRQVEVGPVGDTHFGYRLDRIKHFSWTDRQTGGA
jgi:hypothetical protein